MIHLIHTKKIKNKIDDKSIVFLPLIIALKTNEPNNK
jgi:hypothetical protein